MKSLRYLRRAISNCKLYYVGSQRPDSPVRVVRREPPAHGAPRGPCSRSCCLHPVVCPVQGSPRRQSGGAGSRVQAACVAGPDVVPRRRRTATAQVSESRLGRSSQLDDDGLSCDGHAIADGELLALSGFDRAVDQHTTFTNELFRFAAAADEPAEFEELAKLDGNLAHGDGAFVA